MVPITNELHKQIKGWRIYSIIVPAIFCAVAAFMYLHHGTEWKIIFYTGMIVLAVTCISWWHWSLSTMLTMIGIMKETDDHFEQVTKKLEELRVLHGGRPDLKIVTNTVDKDK